MTLFAVEISAAAGVAASVTVAAPGAGRRNVVRAVQAVYTDSVAGNSAAIFTIITGASVLYRTRLGIITPDYNTTFQIGPSFFVGGDNTSIVLSFSSVTATGLQQISAQGIII